MYSHETSPAPVWSVSVCLDCASVLSIVLAAQIWAIPMELIMMSKEPGKVSNLIRELGESGLTILMRGQYSL